MAYETSLSVGVDTRQAVSGLRQFDQAVNKTARNTADKMRRTESSFERLKRGIFSIKGAIAGIGAGLIVREFIRVASTFEQLRIQLKTVTGSAKAAEAAFADIKRQAADTPFQVENLTQAFIQLKAIGIEPTEERMRAFGDVAAGLGRDITDFTRAAVGAAFGETEALKSFGIAAKVEGDKISLTFKGVTQTVDRNANSVIEALTKIGQTNFSGAAEDQVRSFNGAMSNLNDAIAELFDTIAQAGVLDFLADRIRDLRDIVQGFTGDISSLLNLFKEMEQQSLDSLKEQLDAVNKSIERMQARPEFLQGMADAVAENLPFFESLNEKLEKREKILARIAALEGKTGDKPDSGGTIIDVGKFSKEAIELAEEYEKKLDDLAQTISNEVKTAFETFSQRIESLDLLLKTGRLTFEEYSRAVDMAKEKLIESDPILSRVNDGIGQFSDALVDAAVEGESFADAMKQTFRSLVTDILKELNRLMISKAMQSLVGGGLGGGGGGILGSLFGMFGGGASSNFGGSFFAATAGGPSATSFAQMAAIPFANGGIVSSPTVFPMANGMGLMGEAGPEAIMPLSRGPDGKLGVRGGGGGTVINIDARGSNGDAAVEAAVERGIRRAAPNIVGASVNRVRQERQRDPDFFGRGALS